MNKPTSKPSYAENLLFHADFRFEPRSGDKLNLDRISQVNIQSIIEQVDIEKLSSFLEDLTFCQVDEDDMQIYPDETFIKLFQIVSLTIEYLVDTQDTLSANLNGLATKYAKKKREIEGLNNTLATQDSELATLRDELYYHRKYVRSSIGSKDGCVNRTDPSQYPSQERRPTPAPTEDAPSEPSMVTSSQKDDELKDYTVRLHIVSASTATHTEMTGVAENMTIQNLKNKLVSRLLVAGDYSVNFETHALYHKGVELSDPAQTLRHYGVQDDAALVLLEKVLPNDNAAAADVEVTNIVESINSTSIVESKLEELTSIALKSQEELVQAARTLQFQVSTQEYSKEVFVKEIGEQLKSLVSEAIAEHTEKHAQENHKSNNNTNENVNVEKYLSDIASPLSKLNMGELVETDGDCDEDNAEDSIEEPESVPKNEGKIDNSESLDSSNGNDTNKMSIATEESSNCQLHSHIDPVLEETHAKVIPLKVDTSAEVLDANPSPFNPPSEVEFEVASESKGGVNEDMEENKTQTSLSTMHYSAASSTQLAFSLRSDSVEDGLGENAPAKAAMSPANKLSTTAASAQEFRFSEYEFSPEPANADQIAEVVGFNTGEYNTIDNNPISDTALEIAPAKRSATLDSLDASLVSIEVSHSEFITTVAEMEAHKGKVFSKKKKGRFSLKKMKKLSVKSFVGCSKK